MTINGTTNDDSLAGTANADIIDFSQGGSDTVAAEGKADTLMGGGAFEASDQIDGGAGYDTLVLDGDYSSEVVFGAATLTNVDAISLADGFAYRLTSHDATVAAGRTLLVDGSALASAGSSMIFNGAAETDGAFTFQDGSHDDLIRGGQKGDVFTSSGGVDQFFGNGGNDVFDMGSFLTAADRLYGGTGTDRVSLAGDYSGGLTLGSLSLIAVEELAFGAGFDYALTTVDANVAAGQTLTVDAYALGSPASLFFDGSAETNGAFDITGGMGHDTLTGGAGDDRIDASRGGDDSLAGGAGNDVFVFNAGFTAEDEVHGGSGVDRLHLGGDLGNEAISLGVENASGIERITFGTNFLGGLQTRDSLVAAGESLVVDAHALKVGHNLYFYASDTDGFFEITGGAGDDVLFGGDQGDVIDGGFGNDILAGGDGIDIMMGGAGNDLLFGIGGGDDLMTGGVGDDAYYIDSLADVVMEATGEGTDTVASETRSLELAGYANVENASLLGTVDLNLTGQGGKNVLTGNDGRNVIQGGGGDDTLTGGLGADDLYGGGGHDKFVYAALAESGIGAADRDSLVGFGSGDRIDVSAIDANELSGGNQAFVLDTGGAFATGEIRQTLLSGNLLLEFNTDAGGAAEMSILLANRTAVLAAGDFVL